VAKEDGGHWLPIHTGLLDDERFMEAGPAREAWLILYLALDREPDVGWFRDRARVVFLLRKHGASNPEASVAALEGAGWLESEHDDSPRLTIRRWAFYTDLDKRKAVHNRARATTRAGRGDGLSPVEKGGDLDETRRDETRRDSPRKRANGRSSVQPSVAEFREHLAKTQERTS
jgi:hypothetical protein